MTAVSGAVSIHEHSIDTRLGDELAKGECGMGDDLTWRGKLGFGGACAVCCVVPMLILAGVVSAGTALTGGAALGSLALVGMGVLAVVSGRGPQVTGPVRLAIAVGGLGLATTGLIVLRDSLNPGRSLVSVGLAVLALAALAGPGSDPMREPR